MAAQVEVQTGEVGRTVAGGRLHLSPLTDSSNTGPIEISQSRVITPEINKPVPGPKPRLTPKPFAVEKNPTIKPIVAPKPQTKPKPESTHIPGYKPELPCTTSKPQPAAATIRSRPVCTNPSRPAPTSFRTSTKLHTGQTVKPVVQPFKPAPPLDLIDPSKPTVVPVPRQKPDASSLVYSRSLKTHSVSEWSDTTKKEDLEDQTTSSAGGGSMTRARSMGFIAQFGEDDDLKEKIKPAANVPLRPQPRGTRPRPVSAIFLSSPTKTETPVSAPRWGGRRPLSADLTSKFESFGLSLHHKSSKANTKENTPEQNTPHHRQKQEKNLNTTPTSDEVAKPIVCDKQSDKTAEETSMEETDEDRRGVSIKSRISLLLDLSSSPGTSSTGQMSEPQLQPQPVPETESQVGVKQLIKQLTEDVTPTQSPILKPAVKPRPLPIDLTKRFVAERSPDLSCVSLTDATDHQGVSKDPPPQKAQESAITPSDERVFVEFEEQHENLSSSESPEARQMISASCNEFGPGNEVQTVRASLFDNVVERHNIHMPGDTEPTIKSIDLLGSPPFRKGNNENEGTLVTASYKEPVSPSSPQWVLHAVDTVHAVEESRAVSKSIPTAQWEDKALTLRSKRLEGNNTNLVEQASVVLPEQKPRYLRVGALQKWNIACPNQEAGLEKSIPKQTQREEMALNIGRDKQREAEEDEATAAPKRLKTLETEDRSPKPRATYFALTGQIQEPLSALDDGADIGDTRVSCQDFSVSSQGMIVPVRRHPSFDQALQKNLQDQEKDTIRGLVIHQENRSSLEGPRGEEIMKVEKKKELQKEAERHKGKIKEIEREKQRQLEIERQAFLEYARMKDREMQREFERQRQKEFEKEKQEFEEKQRALEKQNQLELEKQKMQKLQREKQKEYECERERQLEKERQRELEKQREEKKQREMEKERQREQEKLKQIEEDRQHEQEKQRLRAEERQRELDKERKLMEIQKEKRRMEELARVKELERIQLLEFQKQQQKEKERKQILEAEKQRLREKMAREETEKMKQMALEHELHRLKELDKEREKQREMEKECLKEIEREKQRELERHRHRELERERQKQLDIERQELENQRVRQQQLERERLRKEEIERIKEMERRQLLEFEKQKQAERERQQIEIEKQRLREKMEKEEAEKMRQIARQQDAERQRLKDKQKREEQERVRLDSAPLRPKVLDLDSVLRNDPSPRATPKRSDPMTRWKEPSSAAEESYKPAILDIDSFISQTQFSPGKDLLPVSGIQGSNPSFGTRSQPAPDRSASWKVPTQTSGSVTTPEWTSSPQDPWELTSLESPVDKPAAELSKHSDRLSIEQQLFGQDELLCYQKKHFSGGLDVQHLLTPLARTDIKTGGLPGEVSGSATAEQIWSTKEPQPQANREERSPSYRRSHGSQDLNRIRSRSVSRRSAPSGSAVEASLSRIRSRSAHRDRDRHSWVQQKQSVASEEEGKDSETPLCETDSQYGTWDTGLRTDDSLTPATPSSESNLSPSLRNPTPSQTPDDHTSKVDADTLDGLHPSSSPDNLSFPEAPITLLDNSALRSRAQLARKRAPRTRPSRAAHQSTEQAEGGTSDDWLYRDSTEEKLESKNGDSDSEEQARGAVAASAATSQPQRIALFPGVDPLALKAQLRKRGDSDNQSDGPSPSQLSRSPKSPFLPRAARVLPPPGGKENCEEDSPQWLKELKSKKRLSQYENES